MASSKEELMTMALALDFLYARANQFRKAKDRLQETDALAVAARLERTYPPSERERIEKMRGHVVPSLRLTENIREAAGPSSVVPAPLTPDGFLEGLKRARLIASEGLTHIDICKDLDAEINHVSSSKG